jgi:lysophospholipase L1-like esterase
MRNNILFMLVTACIILLGLASTPSDIGKVLGGKTLSYVALGDSITAGSGLAFAKDATKNDQSCGRSPQVFASLIAKERSYTLTNLACGGVTAPDIFQRRDGDTVAASDQLAQLAKLPKPDLITITAGANDAGWVPLLFKCWNNTCGDSDDDAAAKASLDQLKLSLSYLFARIDAQYDRLPPRIMAVGYYQAFSAQCGPEVNSAEQRWISSFTDDLNGTIRDTAALFPHVEYLEPDFSGHDSCSEASWIIADPSNAAFLHPNAAGHEAYARAILSHL